MKKVSIIIPTFNQIKYLPACVDNCLFQSYQNIELIIVDGGSSDGTKDYLKNLKDEIKNKTINPVIKMDESGRIVREEIVIYPQNRKIKILSFKNDIGATGTYNKGFKFVTGEYCTYIVGDDIPHPYMIEEMVKTLESTNSDFIYSDMNVVDDDGRIVRQIKLPDYDFKTCFADWYHLGVSHLYKSELHHAVGVMDEENYQSANDYDHYLRFAMSGAEFFHLPKILYSIRYHGENRKTGQHTSENYKKLMEESKKCAWRARDFMETGKI